MNRLEANVITNRVIEYIEAIISIDECNIYQCSTEFGNGFKAVSFELAGKTRDIKPYDIEILKSYIELEDDAIIIKKIAEISDDIEKVGCCSEIFCQTKELVRYVKGIAKVALHSPKDEAAALPKELYTDKAKALLDKAKEAGFLDEGYKWKDTQQLAAYFAYRASQSLNLSNRQDSQGNMTTCWKPFEALFGYETGKRVLSTAKANWMRINTRFEPTGYEQIDDLFTT